MGPVEYHDRPSIRGPDSDSIRRIAAVADRKGNGKDCRASSCDVLGLLASVFAGAGDDSMHPKEGV